MVDSSLDDLTRADPEDLAVEPSAADGRFDDDISLALRDLMGGMKPGDRLPNERDMAIDLGVSRNALRDRIRLLEAVGVVSRRQGSGTYVEETFNPDGLVFAMDLLISTGQLKLWDLHLVRVGLERQAAILAAEGSAQAVHLAEMRDAIRGMDASYGTQEVAAEDVRFHRVLFRSADNPALSFFADALRGVLVRAIDTGSSNWLERQVGRKLLVAVHEEIVDAIERGDPSAAAAAVDAHFAVFTSVVSGKL
jgi:GntR family transcriptional regulator, transcriptional repressor for pyruvate dehydrogenase complex